MEGIGDQADDEVVLGELCVEGLVVGDIERDGRGSLDTGRESLGGLQSSASWTGVRDEVSNTVLLKEGSIWLSRERSLSYRQ